MEMNLFRALSQCKDVPGFRIDAWIVETEWSEKVAEALKLQNNRRKTALMKVQLAIFGQRSSGEQVATALGHYKQFLQPPDLGMVDCSYENPQSLQLPDNVHKTDNHFSTTSIFTESKYMAVDTDRTRRVEAAQIVDLIASIEDWFDQLPARRSIALIPKDSRLLGTLFE